VNIFNLAFIIQAAIIPASDEMLAEFDQQLEWFYRDQKKFLSVNEKEFKESGEWNKACEQTQQTQSEIEKSKKEFIKFRNEFLKHMTLTQADSAYSRALIQNADEKITKVYIESMQDCLFPMKWEQDYEEYLNQKK